MTLTKTYAHGDTKVHPGGSPAVCGTCGGSRHHEVTNLGYALWALSRTPDPGGLPDDCSGALICSLCGALRAYVA